MQSTTGTTISPAEPVDPGREKILLALLPFWDSLIPPIGIACLKSYLKQQGCRVKTVDASVEPDFRDFYDQYFNLLGNHVPEDKKGNFLSVGHDILRNQLTAFLNITDEAAYLDLVELLIYKTFYVKVDREVAGKLHDILSRFYARFDRYMLDLLEREKPTVLGLSVFSNNLPVSMRAFAITRKNHPHIKTVMGGGVFADQLAEGSENLAKFMETTQDYLDHLIIGEGELLLLKLLKGELPSSQRLFTFTDIQRQILDLSAVEAVDMSDFDLRSYPYVVSYASRSCPFQCSFCSETLQWGKYRKKPPQKVLEELLQLYKRHGSQLFLLTDSLLNPVMTGLATEFVKAETVLYWEGWLRVDNQVCSLDNTLHWRRSGFYHARLGIESGSTQVLELMGKNITLDQIRASISALANAGIKTTTLWVVGHPGESEEDFQQTLDLIAELRSDIYEAECRPFYYYPLGQVGAASDWWKNLERLPLYPKESENLLLFQTWLLDCQPTREVSYQRMRRFVKHCKDLGVPNPYSMHEIYEADARWKKLHKHAVPPLVEFKNTEAYITECRKIKKVSLVQVPTQADKDQGEYMNFGF
jgi:radical SAM superfamily enzyme YgiQ (UPF0313 family)